jgi:glycosyltransferase involved in cell wall biosynthesis
VLLASPLPPPRGGIATWTQIVRDQGFCSGYVPVLVDTTVSARRGAFEEEPALLDELWRNLRIVCAFCRQLFSAGVALAHVNSSLAPRGLLRDLCLAVLARARWLPVVVQYHGAFPDPRDARLGPTGRAALRCLVRLASANLVLSTGFVEPLRRCGGARAHVLPNFIERDVLARPAVARQSGDELRVLYVGSLIPSKGSRELVEVARRLPEHRFRALGVLPSGERLDAPANLELAGPAPREHVLQALDESDALLFPSHGEGFPYAVLEAMAARLPVVASRVGAIPDMIDEGRGGFLVEPGDIAGLCAALTTLAGDSARRTAMGAHNRARVESDFTHAQVMEQLARVYDELGATSR